MCGAVVPIRNFLVIDAGGFLRRSCYIRGGRRSCFHDTVRGMEKLVLFFFINPIGASGTSAGS